MLAKQQVFNIVSLRPHTRLVRSRHFQPHDLHAFSDWEKIVGKEFASKSIPTKIYFPRNQSTGGTLYLEISNSAIAFQIQFTENIILERIATYFGYKAISKLSLKQNTTLKIDSSKNESTIKERYKAPQLPKTVDEEIESIEDEDLKAALMRMADSMKDACES